MYHVTHPLSAPFSQSVRGTFLVVFHRGRNMLSRTSVFLAQFKISALRKKNERKGQINEASGGICKPHVSWTVLSGPAVHTSQPAWYVGSAQDSRKKRKDKEGKQTKRGRSVTTDIYRTWSGGYMICKKEKMVKRWWWWNLSGAVTVHVKGSQLPRLLHHTFQMLSQRRGGGLTGTSRA